MDQENIDYLYQDGRHYDQQYASSDDDFSFWIDQANQFGDPVLELACGTGRFTIVLAQAGYSVTGIDTSEAMLKEGKRKSAEAGVEVTWGKADMRDFNLDKKFSLIILTSNTLGHLLTLSDFEACMASVRKHLAPNGRFIIEVFVPKMEMLINKPGERFPFSEYDDPDGRGKIVVTHSYVYEPATQIKRIKTYHAIPGEDTEIEGEINLQMYFPQYLDALLKYNGFEIENKYGSDDLSAFDSSSQKQLVVCKLSSNKLVGLVTS